MIIKKSLRLNVVGIFVKLLIIDKREEVYVISFLLLFVANVFSAFGGDTSRVDSLLSMPYTTEVPPHYGLDEGMPLSSEAMKAAMTFPYSWEHWKDKGVEEWKKNALPKLQQCLSPAPPMKDFDARIIDSEVRDGGYKAYKIVLNISTFDRVPAYLLIPTNKKGPFPAVTILHDHGGTFCIGKEKNVKPLKSEYDREIKDYIKEWDSRGRRQYKTVRLIDKCNEWVNACYDGVYIGDFMAQQGYVVLCVDELFWGERCRKQGADYDKQAALASNLTQLGYSWCGISTHNDIAAVEFLKTLPIVKSDKIGTIGFSMGAHRAWRLSAMCDDVKAGAAISWMNITDSLMTTRNNQSKGGGFSMNIPFIVNYMDIPDVAALACPKAMLFYNGTRDHLFPVEGVKESYRIMRSAWDSAGVSDKLVTQLWDEKHFFSKEMQQSVLQFMNKHLK